MSNRSLLQSQMRYYDARAHYYDASLDFRSGRFWRGNPDCEALAALQRTLRALPRVRTTLEIACGTGIWTRELLKSSRTLHALDASANMIALNRSNLGENERVSYECADVFTWKPARRFDRVAAAFWISHVPDDLLEPFVQRIEQANAPRGDVLIIDEECGSDPAPQTTRALADGRSFPIVKVFRTAEQIECVFEKAAYRPHIRIALGRLFALLLRRRK